MPEVKNKLIKNAVSNWVPLMINMIFGLILTPMMIGHLGKDGYGVWALVVSFIGYYGFLRFGISSGVMRYVPYYSGRSQLREANEIIVAGNLPLSYKVIKINNDVVDKNTNKQLYFELSPNYPNPFNPETTIRYTVPENCRVNIDVFNLLGQKICNLVNEKKSAGNYSTIWDGRDNNGKHVTSGVYIYRIKANDFIDAKKMLLIR